MAEKQKHRNLGRGLSALLGDVADDYSELDRVRAVRTVPIGFIEPGRYQPRRIMDDDLIDDLAESLREKGVLQPLLVRRDPEVPDRYEIIAGERRWRAAQKAGLHELPVVVKELTDKEALEIALVENLQRQDLSSLEEAEGYQRLMDEFSHTQEQLAKAVGKSRSHVANMLRLLSLPEPIKAKLDSGQLTAGHARALLTAKNPTALAEKVVRKGLNVRQTEKLAQQEAARSAGATKSQAKPKDADTLALERDLANLLGLKVEITFRGAGGRLTIHYSSLDQLDEILHRLSHGSGHGGGGLPDAAADVESADGKGTGGA